MTPTLTQLAKEHWLGWPPHRVKALAFFVLLVPMLGTIWNIYDRADSILQQSLKQHLLSAAQVIAGEVDTDTHGLFQNPAQESGEVYRSQIAKMDAMKRRVDPNRLIKFVYTCIKRSGAIHFVLDTTPTGDSDHDGQDDKSHIMELYEAPSETLRQVLETGNSRVDDKPYRDRRGTFMSAFAPLKNSQREVIGAVGVDIALDDYQLQLASLRYLAILCALGVVCLAYVAAFGAGMYHRRLQRSVGQLLAASEESTAAARVKVHFLGAMSHELRTPLNAIIGMSEVLQDTRLDETQQSHLRTIQESSESLLEKVTDILDFSQLDSGQVTINRAPLSLTLLGRDMQRSFGPAMERKKLDFRIRLSTKPDDRFKADPLHIRQILRHLLANAIKFTDSGGVTLEMASQPAEGSTETLSFTVRDTGIGMSEEEIAMLFVPFHQVDFSTTRRHGGTGIGLAICKRLCDLMGGRIWVESKPGAGSAFQVDVPAERLPAGKHGSSPHGDAILCTQDTIVRLLVSQVVEKQGHVLRTCESHAEMIKELELRPATWIFVDAPIARAEQIDWLRESFPDARMIVLNAGGGWSGERYAEVVFLPQPVRPGDLKQAMVF